MVGGCAFARDLLDWAAEVIKKFLRPVNHVQFDRGLERKRERERIARELHDTLLQGLLGVTLQLQGAVDQVPADLPSRAGLDRAMVRMRHVIDETRKILLGLRSPATESTSLEQALSAMGEFAAGGEVQFRVFVAGQPRTLMTTIHEQIYLICREAMINAFRHSEASSIEAEVQYLPRRLRILVRDNGCGMDPKTACSRLHAHWGLLGMRERADSIGAQLRIWSRPGSGTEVEISITGRTLSEAYL